MLLPRYSDYRLKRSPENSAKKTKLSPEFSNESAATPYPRTFGRTLHAELAVSNSQ